MFHSINHRVRFGFALSALVACAWVSSFTLAQQPAATSAPQPPPAEQRQPRVPPEVAAANAAFDAQDWPKAVELYRAAMAAGYEYAFVQMRTGYALHVQGKHAEALPYHLKAANAQQKAIRVDGLYNAACAYALTGDKPKAFEFLLKAIDAGFLDTRQIESDGDLQSLRDDPQSQERFRKIVASIGVEPTLSHWMDFFLGEWEQFDSESSTQMLDQLTLRRPLEGSNGIVSVSRNAGGGQWTGLVWPDSDERIWRWIKADGNGTTHEFTGTRLDDGGAGGMVFQGQDFSPAGPSVSVRLTFTPTADGRVMEKAEVSSDGGKIWRGHHQAWYVRKLAAKSGE